MLVPPRSTKPELLDQAPPADAVLARNLHEMAILYRLTGGFRLGWRLLEPLIQPRCTILDVAAGDASLSRMIQRRSGANVIACDLDSSVSMIAARAGMTVVQADGCQLPFADDAFDLVHCCQALHHFEPEHAVHLLQEIVRVATHGAVLVDLERSWLGYAGAWLTTRLPMFTPLARHDGALSVLKAYTLAEVRDLAQRANVRIRQTVRNGIYWGISISKA